MHGYIKMKWRWRYI